MGCLEAVNYGRAKLHPVKNAAECATCPIKDEKKGKIEKYTG